MLLGSSDPHLGDAPSFHPHAPCLSAAGAVRGVDQRFRVGSGLDESAPLAASAQPEKAVVARQRIGQQDPKSAREQDDHDHPEIRRPREPARGLGSAWSTRPFASRCGCHGGLPLRRQASARQFLRHRAGRVRPRTPSCVPAAPRHGIRQRLSRPSAAPPSTHALAHAADRRQIVAR